MKRNLITVLPNASSLIESMRSIGYSFETAIADIIDNSISAKANQIDIFQRINDSKPYVQIIDDGNGMSREELIEAITLGSKNPLETREKSDLGRFGIGLKSASFSQCRKLTVISKKNNELNAYQWDLDLVRITDSFDVICLTKEDISLINNIEMLNKRKNGTIVQWEEFDRIRESTLDLSDELAELMNKAVEHISLIFHRFLEGGLNIDVNFESVLPKDPFLKNHVGTQELKDKKVIIDGEIIYLQPYIIPHFSRLTSKDQRKSGKVNEQYRSQGFYLYRNKRLIVWGDYLGLSRKKELTKNVRIKVDIPNNLDYLWEIDVKKSRASVPSKIKKNLLSTITDGEIVSKRVNTHKGKKELKLNKPMWQFYSERDESFYFKLNSKNPLYEQFTNTLTEDQKKIFLLFSKSLEATIPYQAIYSQIGSGKNHNVTHEETDELVTNLNEAIRRIKEIESYDLKVWLNSIISEEPYASNDKAKNLIYKELEKYDV